MPKRLSTQPYKGSRDLLPEDFQIQEYIFNTWKEVCLEFGYREYQTPLLESADLYRAKSGADVGGKELFTLTDLAGRELAIRPEMTPSVTRLVSKIYKEEPKPIRLFNISNFLRNERPQKGRNREFWQLNADIFGEDSINADLEIITLALELMLAFNPPKGSFKLYYNSRILIEDFMNNILNISEQKEKATLARAMDKYEKFDDEIEFKKYCSEIGINEYNTDLVIKYMGLDRTNILSVFDDLSGSDGIKNIVFLQESLEKLGYGEYIEFKPNVIRGFDYYDGMIFEVFDTDKSNPRSLFGGGRYNGLAQIFGMEPFPAVGFAPGDETFRLFLENWDILPDTNKYYDVYYFPLLEGIDYIDALSVANKMRAKGYKIQQSLKQQGLSDALRDANKLNFNYVVIYGTEEKDKKTVTIKDMAENKQQLLNL